MRPPAFCITVKGGLLMEDIQLRTAGPADLPAILGLYRLLDAALVDMQPEFFCTAPRDETLYAGLLADPQAAFFLAEAGGVPVGLALVKNAGWTPEFSSLLPHRYAELYDLVVEPAWRGRGIGGLLLGAAKRWARDRRLEYLELNVLSQNDTAIALYESHDFVESSRTMRCML